MIARCRFQDRTGDGLRPDFGFWPEPAPIQLACVGPLYGVGLAALGASRRFRDNISCCIPALRPQSPPQALADPAMPLLRWIQLPVHANPSNTASAHSKIKIGTVGLAQPLANPS